MYECLKADSAVDVIRYDYMRDGGEFGRHMFAEHGDMDKLANILMSSECEEKFVQWKGGYNE